MREQIEYARQQVGGDSDAAVVHRENEGVIAAICTDIDTSRRRCELNRVMDEIADNLAQPRGIGVESPCCRLPRDLNIELMVARYHQTLRLLDCLIEDRAEGDRFLFERDFPLSYPANIEQIVHQASQLFRLPPGDRERAVAALSIALRSRDRVEDGSEGVARLMPEHCEKLVLAAIRLGELSDRPLEQHRFPLQQTY